MQVGSVSLGQIAFLSLRAVDGESDLIMVLIQEEMGRVRWWLYLIAFVLRNELNCKYIILSYICPSHPCSRFAECRTSAKALRSRMVPEILSVRV
jgi:hypothetical protein